MFFNYSNMNMNMIPVIIANLNYSICEYDYKFCKYRSIEKHKFSEGLDCDCQNQQHGKMISAFMHGADTIFWMSEKQKNIYLQRFKFLENNKNIVLSSVFDTETLDLLSDVRKKSERRNNKWLIINSPSWIKGASESEKFCEENGYDYELVWNIDHDQLLKKMGLSKGLIFQPLGGDTCPRVVIEAKLSGCELILNDNVQHKEECWFKDKDPESIEKHLRENFINFWNQIEGLITKKETISGYTTTLNCIDQKYPFEQSIKSMLAFCDQVVVVDGGSSDGTWEALELLSNQDDRLIIEKRKRDWSHPRFAVFDGLQKAYARSLCTGDWCWQMDSDEIVHEKDVSKIKNLITQMPKSAHLLALPVIEYWGSDEKVRIDVNPWKWRLSRNHKHITHGIPKGLRTVDEDGNLHSLPGSDGCNYIDSETYEVIPCLNFYDQNIHNLRVNALSGNEDAVQAYENWLNNVIENLPGVHHYSWYDLERKIHTYKNYWSKHWQSLYNIEQEDTAENNMFFDKKWADVSDDEIKQLSIELKDKMGGWIFHNKVDFKKPTPHVYIERGQPEIMKNVK